MVGPKVGSAVGDNDGDAEGSSVGEPVGSRVGATEGSRVGCSDGEPVGSSVGTLDGPSDGRVEWMLENISPSDVNGDLAAPIALAVVGAGVVAGLQRWGDASRSTRTK